MIALITGASSGIGEATARLLAQPTHGPGKDRRYTLVLVARRAERLEALAAELGDATFVAVDLTDDDAPARVAEHVRDEHGGRLDLLVNNAGAAWRGRFGDTGFENVQRHMRLNFDATLRLTEAVLPLLRASAPSSIVNVASTAGRISRGNSGAYSASKFALCGWSDALYQEERAHGVHVGLVLPGFITTEGFPQKELVEHPLMRRIVSTPDKVAAAIVSAGPGGKAEVYVPWFYAIPPALRILAPWLIRRLAGGPKATPATGHGDD